MIKNWISIIIAQGVTCWICWNNYINKKNLERNQIFKLLWIKKPIDTFLIKTTELLLGKLKTNRLPTQFCSNDSKDYYIKLPVNPLTRSCLLYLISNLSIGKYINRIKKQTERKWYCKPYIYKHYKKYYWTLISTACIRK